MRIIGALTLIQLQALHTAAAAQCIKRNPVIQACLMQAFGNGPCLLIIGRPFMQYPVLRGLGARDRALLFGRIAVYSIAMLREMRHQRYPYPFPARRIRRLAVRISEVIV